jgi:tRNA(Ile2) C34 agmatinyltransferase TiaS
MKMGHLEKREFYCYKCGNKMESNGGSLFVCRTCGVEYNRQPFDYEVRYASSNNSYDEYDDIF